MEAFQNRLDSFKPKKVKHGSKNVTLKWPHPEHFKANAQSLAEAGFYFDPSFDDKDAVKCFMCGKMLSEWEEEDDPFDIHWSKCAKTCAWANVRCGLREDMNEDGGQVFLYLQVDPCRDSRPSDLSSATSRVSRPRKLWKRLG